MEAIAIDESRFPLVTVTFNGPVPDPDFAKYLETMSRLLRRRLKSVMIFDARRASPTAKQRSEQAMWLKDDHDAIRDYSCGSVFIISSALVRGALTAILWVSPIPGAYTVVSTLEEAEKWALDRLAAAKVSLPSIRPSAGM